MIDNAEDRVLLRPGGRVLPGEASLTLLFFLLLSGASLLLYTATLAPTVTWGDDATLQLAAVQDRIAASAGSHPAWIALAHLLSRLPFVEPAYGVNLASAIPAAIAVGLLFKTFRVLGLSLGASVAGCVAFAVSHTFWLHAVRAEVYALTLATQAVVIWAAVSWRQKRRLGYLILAVMTIGLGLTVHVMILLCVPAVVWLLVAERRALSPRAWAELLVCAAASLVPLGLLLARDNRQLQYDLWGLINWAFFTFDAYDFRRQMLQLAPATLVQDLGSWLLFLGYQFVGVAFLLGCFGALRARRKLPLSLVGFLVLLYLVPALFAFSYRVGDQFVFYLPSYLAFAVLIGLGADVVLERSRRAPGRPGVWPALALVALLALTPVTTYWLTPRIMQHYGWQFRPGRFVPGPNGRYFLLWPPKAGYYDARAFAEETLASMPRDGVLLADPILASPVQYLQSVEKLRPDVTIHYCCWALDALMEASAGRPVALADIDRTIYPVDRLKMDYDIVRKGNVYLLFKAVHR